MSKPKIAKHTALNNILCSLLCLFLAACAASTSQEPRDHPGEVYTFKVHKNYQAVTKIIAEHSRNYWATDGETVDFNIYSELSQVEVLWRLNSLGNVYYDDILIKKIDQNNTEVTVYGDFSVGPHIGPKIEAWIK